MQTAAVSSQAALTDSPRDNASTAKLAAPSSETSDQMTIERSRRMKSVRVGDEIEYALTFAAIHTSTVRHYFRTAAVAVSLACASRPAETGAPPAQMRPLERLSGQEILVLPVQYLSATDSLGWMRSIPNRAAFLDDLDGQIERELTARGLGSMWTFGREVARASKLNSILMADARTLSAEWLRGRVLEETAVRDPLASQVRGLVGLKGSRYALLPVEVRLSSRGGTGVATLRVVLIDSRMALLKGVWEVSSDPMTTFSPALTASVARHFADLVVAP